MISSAAAAVMALYHNIALHTTLYGCVDLTGWRTAGRHTVVDEGCPKGILCVEPWASHDPIYYRNIYIPLHRNSLPSGIRNGVLYTDFPFDCMHAPAWHAWHSVVVGDSKPRRIASAFQVRQMTEHVIPWAVEALFH
jgi:hypothetical protein